MSNNRFLSAAAVVMPVLAICCLLNLLATPISSKGVVGSNSLTMLNSITIDPIVSQGNSTRTVRTSKASVARSIIAYGDLRVGEQCTRPVTTPVPGWVTKVHGPEGAHVHQWAVVAEILTTVPNGTNKPSGNIGETSQSRAVQTVQLRTPVEGHIQTKHISNGAAVKPGQVIIDVTTMSVMYLYVRIPESEMPCVYPGQPANIVFDSSARSFEGIVDRIGTYEYERSCTTPVSIRLKGHLDGLIPGMCGRAMLLFSKPESAVLIPKSAVLNTGVKTIALVLTSMGRIEPRIILLGIESANGFCEVIAGLEENETIVFNPNLLIDGEAAVSGAIIRLTEEGLIKDES